jgi:hypothetical protein
MQWFPARYSDAAGKSCAHPKAIVGFYQSYVMPKVGST